MTLFHLFVQIMGEEGFVVRLRGLPWSATPEDVEKFFDGENVYF